MFILSLLPMGYSCGEVWINPPLVNQPVAKRHPSIPLIHGWIMKWSKLVFLSWLPSGKLKKNYGTSQCLMGKSL